MVDKQVILQQGRVKFYSGLLYYLTFSLKVHCLCVYEGISVFYKFIDYR